jgi:hypothetical protein
MVEPVVQPIVENPLIVTALISSISSLVVGYLGKTMWDYYSGGRMEKSSIYMSRLSCQTTREHCSVVVLRNQVYNTHGELETFKAETKIRLRGIDKRLDQSNQDIQGMRTDISEIKQTSARSNALLETILKGIDRRVTS